MSRTAISDDKLNEGPEEGRTDGNVWNAILTAGITHFGSDHVTTLRMDYVLFRHSMNANFIRSYLN